MAKKLLANNNLKYRELSLEGKTDELKNLIEKTNHKTVPQIFINKKFIGGYTELKNLIIKIKNK